MSVISWFRKFCLKDKIKFLDLEIYDINAELEDGGLAPEVERALIKEAQSCQRELEETQSKLEELSKNPKGGKNG